MCPSPSSPDPAPVHGLTNPPPESDATVMRFGSVIGLRPEKEQYYRELHANAWPSVLEQLRKSGFRNYSIFVAELEGKRYLFSYFEYVGSDFAADMQAHGRRPRDAALVEGNRPVPDPAPHEDTRSQLERHGAGLFHGMSGIGGLLSGQIFGGE